MFKYILPVLALLAAPLAQSFEVKAGSWQFPHRISWQERESKRADAVEGVEQMCVSRTAAADYAKAQAAELEADGCRIEDAEEKGLLKEQQPQSAKIEETNLPNPNGVNGQ